MCRRTNPNLADGALLRLALDLDNLLRLAHLGLLRFGEAHVRLALLGSLRLRKHVLACLHVGWQCLGLLLRRPGEGVEGVAYHFVLVEGEEISIGTTSDNKEAKNGV